MRKLIITAILCGLIISSCGPKSQKSIVESSNVYFESQEEEIEETTNYRADSSSNSQPIDSQPQNEVEHTTTEPIHIDTVEFISASYDYDYWFMDTHKNKDTLMFLINETYDFSPGDRLEVKWRLESVPIAGDGEIMHQSSEAISVKKLSTAKVK